MGVRGKPSRCFEEDRISSQLVARCYINSGMWCRHLIRTKRAAGKILCTQRAPCSFKPTVPSSCSDQPGGTMTLNVAPSRPSQQLQLSLSHHCPANEGPRRQLARPEGTLGDPVRRNPPGVPVCDGCLPAVIFKESPQHYMMLSFTFTAIRVSDSGLFRSQHLWKLLVPKKNKSER